MFNHSRKGRFVTYDKYGFVTYHRFLILAKLKALFQSLILGVSSSVDEFDDYTYTSYRSIKFYEGFLPFKKK